MATLIDIGSNMSHIATIIRRNFRDYSHDRDKIDTNPALDVDAIKAVLTPFLATVAGQPIDVILRDSGRQRTLPEAKDGEQRLVFEATPAEYGGSTYLQMVVTTDQNLVYDIAAYRLHSYSAWSEVTADLRSFKDDEKIVSILAEFNQQGYEVEFGSGNSILFKLPRNSGIMKRMPDSLFRGYGTIEHTLPIGRGVYVDKTTRKVYTGSTKTTEFIRDMGKVYLSGGIPDISVRRRSLYQAWRREGNNDAETRRLEQRAAAQRKAEAANRFEAYKLKADEAMIGVGDDHIHALPFVPHGLKSSRRWGIEVEAAGARGVMAPSSSWDRKYDSSLQSAYDEYNGSCGMDGEHSGYVYVHPSDCETGKHGSMDYDVVLRRYTWSGEDPDGCESCGNDMWREDLSCEDAGCYNDIDDGEDTAEFVSPILTSMHSKGLEKLVGQLALEPQNSTAGVHVHVEANDLTAKEVATLVYGYDMLEPFLEHSYQRETRTYAKRREADDILETVRYGNENPDNPADAVPSGDRYVSVNLWALEAHGTVEFRAMGPVYDYHILIRWAMFCREMVNVVRNGATRKEFTAIRSWEDLLILFARYGEEYPTAVISEREVTDADRKVKVGKSREAKVAHIEQLASTRLRRSGINQMAHASTAGIEV